MEIWSLTWGWSQRSKPREAREWPGGGGGRGGVVGGARDEVE